jgi:hypothetical protein
MGKGGPKFVLIPNDVILVWNKGKLEVEMLELIGSEKKYRNFRERLFSYN